MIATQETGLVAALNIDQRRGVRPCYVDGRCSTKTYLVVASRKEDGDPIGEGGKRVKNLIGVRNLGGDRYRWHAYPDWKFFNMEKPVMSTHSYHNHGFGYDSDILSGEATKALVKQLSTSRGMNVATLELLFPVLQRGFDPNNDATDNLPGKQSY